ncbi:MAG: hypothetical protein LKJ86_00985 [Oscillibacter sp.]|nr:hypothetical protein [Oscillibacter sp.]
MKFETRSSGAPEPQPKGSETPQKTTGKKPVVVYIMILFIVAFVLMAVSFVMHQRSNSEVVGKLQDSVSALQEVQKTEDRNQQLQDELDAAQKQVADLQSQLDQATTAGEAAEQRILALTSLYTLQQQYAGQNFDECKNTIESMEDQGLDKLLSADAGDGITSPAQRYLQLREAVQSK